MNTKQEIWHKTAWLIIPKKRAQPILGFIFSVFVILYFQNPFKAGIRKWRKEIKGFSEVALWLKHKAIPTVTQAAENGSPSNHPWK